MLHSSIVVTRTEVCVSCKDLGGKIPHQLHYTEGGGLGRPISHRLGSLLIATPGSEMQEQLSGIPGIVLFFHVESELLCSSSISTLSGAE